MKMTGVEFTLLEDIDMYNFLEMGIRGGISVISQRHAEANNRYIKDVNDNENYLLYNDANNLYGWAMSEKLPISNFGWCQINVDEIRSYDTNSDIGYIVEVDLTVPKDLHNYFNDYPPAPERLEIRDEMISPISAHIREKRKYKKCFKSTKLAPNLLNKEKYICHVRNLQLYLNLGMVLTKIHRCLSFKQKAWVKPYIEFNTCKRQQATNEFQKAFHKLLNNSFFGKTMESVRKRKNVVLINRESQHIFQTSKPGFKRFSIFSEKLVGMELVKPKIVLDKQSEQRFYIEQFERASGNMKKTWSIINNLRGKNQTSSSFCIKEGNSVITDEKVIANKFNKHFCSLADNLNKDIRKPQACNFRDYLPPSQASSIFLEKTTTAEIISIIEEFENDKSSDIPIIVIKHCAMTIAPTLSSLFNKCIESGEFPNVLKIGRISPIYKKDAKDNVKNYRPISTLPIFGKIFEKVLYSRIYDYVTSKNILSKTQFGFRKLHATSHAIHQSVNFIKKSHSASKHVIGTFIDLSKAFDTIDHNT